MCRRHSWSIWSAMMKPQASSVCLPRRCALALGGPRTSVRQDRPARILPRRYHQSVDLQLRVQLDGRRAREAAQGRGGRALITLSNKRPHRDISAGSQASRTTRPCGGISRGNRRFRTRRLFRRLSTNLLKAEILVDRTDPHTGVVYIEPRLHAEHRQTEQ